ncbi:hypothetical protein OH76DRAFT_1300017, partial [Lentinus brumalis]
LWRPPTEDHFRPLEGVPVRDVGMLVDDFVAPLAELAQQLAKRVADHVSLDPTPSPTHLLEHLSKVQCTYERLRYTAATLRDHEVQIALFRRHWLLGMAYLLYADLSRESIVETVPSVRHDLLGAWTWDQRAARELYDRGIPVWLVRQLQCVPADIRIGSQVEFTIPPIDVARRLSYTPVYEGVIGRGSLLATIPTAHTYHIISRSPTARELDMDARVVTPSRSSAGATLREVVLPCPLIVAKPSTLGTTASRLSCSRSMLIVTVQVHHVRPESQTVNPAHGSAGRDKFAEFVHPWMPPSIPAWQTALSEVDRSTRPSSSWPYWIPEPALILGPQEIGRRRRYIINWVRVRPLWLSRLQVRDGPIEVVNSQMWRVYLNGHTETPQASTVTGRFALNTRHAFSDILHDEVVDGGDVVWHGFSFSEVPDALCPWVIWEVHELAFRYELIALDRACRRSTAFAEDRLARVFPGQSLWSVHHLPSPDSSGLFSPVPEHRVDALNALREVLARWPSCPPELRDASPLSTGDDVRTVEKFEHLVATVYVRTFYSHAGRPPILPHFLP